MLQFFKEYFDEVLVGCDFFNVLCKEIELNWMFVLLLVIFELGECMGYFCVGKDLLLVDVNGKFWILMEDFVIVFFDEIEKLVYLCQCFMVGY